MSDDMIIKIDKYLRYHDMKHGGPCDIFRSVFFPFPLFVLINSPGKLVPSATNEIAVTESFRPTVQPKLDARSPITAVRSPIIVIDTVKQAHPPQ